MLQRIHLHSSRDGTIHPTCTHYILDQCAYSTHYRPQIPVGWRSEIIRPYQETFLAKARTMVLGRGLRDIEYVLGTAGNSVGLHRNEFDQYGFSPMSLL